MKAMRVLVACEESQAVRTAFRERGHEAYSCDIQPCSGGHPELWALMLKWDADSPVSFKADGHTVHDSDARFALEDEGFINAHDRFSWSMLEHSQIGIDYYVQNGV